MGFNYAPDTNKIPRRLNRGTTKLFPHEALTPHNKNLDLCKFLLWEKGRGITPLPPIQLNYCFYPNRTEQNKDKKFLAGVKIEFMLH